MSAFNLNNHGSEIESTGSLDELVQINMDHYRVISDWYYFAILSLAETENFKDDAKYIAKRLNIKIHEARAALQGLERLDLLKRNSNGCLVATGLQYKTSTDISNVYLRHHHYQNLELSRKSLGQDALWERDFSFVNMAVDPKKLPEIKKRIRKFQFELSQFFESGKKQEVYKMCIQLFPQTKKEKTK